MSFKSTPKSLNGYSQTSGTNIRDLLAARNLEILYGGPGDDDLSIASQLFGEVAVLHGGDGNDTYSIKEKESALIVDSDNKNEGGYDKIKFDSTNRTVYLSVIDGSHLLITDIFSLATALIYDAFGSVDPANRIEELVFLDKSYKIEDLKLAMGDGSISAKSWHDLSVITFNKGMQNLARERVDEIIEVISYNQRLLDSEYEVNDYWYPNNLGINEVTKYVVLSGNASNSADEISGTIDRDFIELLDGDDLFEGDDGDDRIYGNMGVDVLLGNKGNDIVYGNKGNDLIYGGQGNDVVFGNLGSDLLYGNKGDDVIHGGKANDIIYGNEGNDWLFGNKGDDELIGGSGSDSFGLTLGSGSATVVDFNGFEGDRVVVSDSYQIISSKNGDAVIVLQDFSSMVLSGLVASQVNLNWIASF